MRRLLTLSAMVVGLGGCVTSPRDAVQALDRGDRRFNSRECVEARKAAAAFDENKDGRLAVGLAGNLIVPFAGTAAALAMNSLKNDDRAALNHRVRAACVSDPLRRKSVARR